LLVAHFSVNFAEFNRAVAVNAADISRKLVLNVGSFNWLVAEVESQNDVVNLNVDRSNIGMKRRIYYETFGLLATKDLLVF